jgi:YfiH family protein
MSIQFGFEIEPKGKTKSLIEQVHGKEIVPFSSESLPADGVFTDKKDQPIYVFTADCIPLLFYSEEEGKIAAVHCGWKGACLGIASEALKIFNDVSKLKIIVGPHILPCCFEVKKDFIGFFTERGKDILPFVQERSGRLYCSLLDYVLRTDLSGVPVGNTDKSFIKCTFCDSSHLPSYRRLGKTDPRIRSWIYRR